MSNMSLIKQWNAFILNDKAYKLFFSCENNPASFQNFGFTSTPKKNITLLNLGENMDPGQLRFLL